MFTLSVELYDWFDSNKSRIRSEIRSGFDCGCDAATETFLTSGNAAAVCMPLCETRGGWNGQWRTAPPYVPAGSVSVCGCNGCID